jgi:hypothetical protein
LAKKPFFSEREVRLARSFIKAIGGNASNGYLLLAVIAWQRAMTKSRDTFWKSLSRYSSVAAGQRLAARLKTRSMQDSKHYRGVLASLRRGGKASGFVEQARDFMLSVQLSAWDRKHYGYKPYEAGYWEEYTVWEYGRGLVTKRRWIEEQKEYDPLAVIWSKLTGHNIPKRYFIDRTVTRTVTPPKPKREPPRQPRSLVHVLPTPDYIGPYSARAFYDARPHLGSFLLPD